jgi:hypothetical protein
LGKNLPSLTDVLRYNEFGSTLIVFGVNAAWNREAQSMAATTCQQ